MVPRRLLLKSSMDIEGLLLTFIRLYTFIVACIYLLYSTCSQTDDTDWEQAIVKFKCSTSFM